MSPLNISSSSSISKPGSTPGPTFARPFFADQRPARHPSRHFQLLQPDSFVNKMEQSDPSREKGDWKLLPEFPNADEILQPQRSSSLPHNPVDTPWASKSEYLETQYRLLRVEATDGLRYSVRSFVEARQELWDDDNTWVYPNVRVCGYLMSKLGPIARVEFGTRSKHKIVWTKSKRLRPGKLVAISTCSDGFRTICKLATIAQRPYFGGLDQDPPLVDLMWANTGDAVLDPSVEMVAVESRHGFFEATRHTLVGLQLSAQSPSPLDKYLLGSHTVDTTPALPANQQKGTEDPNSTPNTPQLDESQTEALGRILSNDELAIVQGPPGTGKTFTSVAAIAAMTALRRKNGGPPLVIAAQTNQSLNHILVNCIDSGIGVLRVGGRSSDTRIQEASLFNLRRRNPKLAPELNREINNVESARQRNILQIETIVQCIFGRKLLNPRALLNWGLITLEQYNSLEDDTTEVDSSLQDMGPFSLWLADGLIPAKILRNRHPILSDSEPAPPTEEELDDDDNEIPHIAEYEEERDGIRGTFIPLHHIWSGKEPAHLTSWTNMVQRELRAPDLFTIRPELRGAVYQHLQARFLAMVQPRFAQLLEENALLCKRFRELKSQQDASIIQRSEVDVVGCTTTGLTKYRSLFCNISPKSLLIEEAAETIEANIVSALYPSLRQLILVGDHQQLAPNCDVQWLKQPPYNLTVSLFQRMINLGVKFTMLKVQRRMTPELRMVLSPFYPDLVDDPNVRGGDIPGMGGINSWFYDHHRWPEETNAEHSKFNEQEAQMVVNFYAYLTANGTPDSKITILTFYVGQRKLLLSKLKRHPSLVSLNFKVHTVDSYQGEENDVVLLSLVRSGPAVSFLEDNRWVVVAISRARRGFYLFGNVDNVLKAGPTADNAWAKIWAVLVGQNRVNPEKGLPLTCQNHSEITWIKDNEDWGEIAGGCNVRCQAVRPCGHFCTLKCHSSPHETLRCSQPCRERLPCGHGCESYCGQPCLCSCNSPTRHDTSQKPQPDQLSTAFPGTLQTRNGGQVNQTTPGQWRTFASNTAVHDENLKLDHAALVKAEKAKVTTTVIKEIYRPTTVLDGFRVEGCQKDMATIEIPTPPLTRTPRNGGDGNDRDDGSSRHLAGLEQFEGPRASDLVFLPRSGDTDRPPPQVLIQTGEPETAQYGGSEIDLARLSISGTATTHRGNSASSSELRAQEDHSEGEEELLIEF